MKALYWISLCALVFISSGDGYSATFISPHIEQNGEIYDIDSYFTSPSELTLSLVDESTRGDWSVEIRTNRGRFENFPYREAGLGECILSPRDYGKFNWITTNRYYDETVNREVCTVRVTFTAQDGEKEERYLKLALGPTRPDISNIEFTYTYDWEKDMIFPNGKFSFDVYSKDATAFQFKVSEWMLFDSPLANAHFATDFKAYESLHIDYEDADWGEHYIIIATNEFNYIESDIIYSNSYISDEDILNRIQELRDEAGVEEVSTDVSVPSFRWDNSALTFDSMIEQCRVYDLSGRLQFTAVDCTTLDLTALPKGIYIIAYQYKSQLFKTKISKL